MNETPTSKTVDAADNAGVIARPPLIYLAALLLGVALDAVWPAPLLAGAAQYWVGGAVMLISLALVIPCFALFRRAGTSVPTETPTTALVDRGPYRFSRNPIYLALSLLYAGIAITADNVWMLGLLAPVLAIMTYGVIKREEAYLERVFGDEYRGYKASVRRWI